jgi:predicted dehydrogenase
MSGSSQGETLSSQPIGIAVVGVGRWGVHLLRNFLAHPQAKVVAVVDPHRDRLQSVAQQFGLSDQVLLTTDSTAIAKLPQVEAIAIATPAATHYALIQVALQQGYHVLAEKPLTLSWQESLELCWLAEQQQRQLLVDHTYLFHPAVRQGKTQIQQGRLGNLRYGYATRTHLAPVRQDVDALWDLAIHDLAIFNHWLGETPYQVQAQGTVWLQPHLGDAQRFPQGLADQVWVRLTYPSGFQATIHLCWCNPDKQRRLCVVGDRGTLIFDELQTMAPLVLQRGELTQVEERFLPTEQSQEIIEVAAAEPLREVCDHFLTCVHKNTPSPISSGWVGAELVQVLAALTRSINQGGEVIKIVRNEDTRIGDRG